MSEIQDTEKEDIGYVIGKGLGLCQGTGDVIYIMVKETLAMP